MHFFHREAFYCLPTALCGVRFRPNDVKLQVRARPPVVTVRISQSVVSVQRKRTEAMTVVAVVAKGDQRLSLVSYMALSPFFLSITFVLKLFYADHFAQTPRSLLGV